MTTDTTISDPHQKALAINLDTARYGTFAEIGAGQEVSRWFFRVGGAAGTIAKSLSAYDIKVSDVTYGQAAQYVSRDRLLPDSQLLNSLEKRLSVMTSFSQRYRYAQRAHLTVRENARNNWGQCKSCTRKPGAEHG